MNTNSNTYTVIYSIGLVVVVAAVLAFVAKFLQPMQDENVKKDTISQILTAADVEFTDDNVLEAYGDAIKEAILVDINGAVVDSLDIKTREVYGTADLKKHMIEEDMFPVYVFENVIVIPCYGAGLWGPIWGYVGVDKTDYTTITKACFGHKGETPGLGAKITDEPAVFADKFTGKTVGPFTVAKNVAATEASAVNAISGATITSQSVGKALNKWFGFYENYFAKMRPAVEQENPEQPEQPAEPAQASEQAQASAEQAAAEEITE
ncbi:MAG: FMN-binding protein [Bacteroidales bacterium]|nr:FMN-binding protein [Bacteroidales bacterium]